MPTYEYRCDSCQKNFDVAQSFHDDPLTECPTCGSPVRKVFGSVGIVFKGSGFYKTDSRTAGASKAPVGDSSASKSESSDGSGGSDGSGSGSDNGSSPTSEGSSTPPTPASTPTPPASTPSPSGDKGSSSSSGKSSP